MLTVTAKWNSKKQLELTVTKYITYSYQCFHMLDNSTIHTIVTDWHMAFPHKRCLP